jgi:hypothetical protein
MDKFQNQVMSYGPEIRPILHKHDSSQDFTKYFDIFSKDKVRIAVTSPPYIKAVDYIYNQMLEYFWIGDLLGLESRNKMNRYKQKYLGTKKIYADEYNCQPNNLFGISQLDNMINHIYEKNHKHGYITYKFFHSMFENLKNISKVLRTGEFYIIVIGNTNVSGFNVESDKFLANLGEIAGYEFITKFTYKIVNRFMRFDRKGRGGIVEQDHVLILKNK